MGRVALFMQIIAVCVFVTVAQATDYVAMVVDVDGRSLHVSDGKPVEVMAFLEENDVVQVEDNAKVVIIFFESSMREAVTGPTLLTIDVDGSRGSAGRTTRIRRESVDYLPPKAQLEKGHHQNFGNIAFRQLQKSGVNTLPLVITSLASGAYVPDVRPMLVWELYPGADSFEVTVTGPTGIERLSTTSSQLSMSDVVQPSGDYSWVLTAKRHGEVVAQSQGQYSIMTQAVFSAMKKQRSLVQAEYPSGGVQELVMLAMLYQSYEMWNEMSLLLLALHKMQPENEEIIRKLQAINPHLLANRS